MTELEIERLGHLGDGIAGDHRLPFTLPAETVRLTATGTEVIRPSPDRVTPPCGLFGTCGGCALQQASDEFVAKWKAKVVARALKAHGLSPEIRPTITSPARSRRRAGFAARRTKKTVQIGFHERASNQIVPISDCHILHPDLQTLLPALKEITRLAASRSAEIRLVVIHAENGADVLIETAKPLTPDLMSPLAGIAQSASIARITWNEETVLQSLPPSQSIAGVSLVPPPGAFLQATREAEVALQSCVLDALGPAKQVVDLFSGCGTFTLAAARTAQVHAVEGAENLLDALDAGWRGGIDLRKVSTEVRDLAARPLLPIELNRYDAAIIDPPRSGAEPQTHQLAQSEIGRIASVSCNPVSFARDAKILCDQGFRLDWVQPVDQFRWSAHVELAAQFSR